MIKTDLKRTQHFTTRSAQICENLLEFIPSDANLIEPFAGGEDLIELFPDASWEKYDIEPTNDTIVKKDTLKTPPSYKGKWVITNPPYLAKNKAKDKELFQQYGLDDLYKISIKTILDSEGGILIIPTNFFTDERSSDIRTEFLNVFDVLKVNIFTMPVFDTTTYSVCSFDFKRKSTRPFFPDSSNKTFNSSIFTLSLTSFSRIFKTVILFSCSKTSFGSINVV